MPKNTTNSWGWPYLRTNSGGDKEYSCGHGVGHGGTHGCDSCCNKMQVLDEARHVFIDRYNLNKGFPTKAYNVYRKLRLRAIKEGLLPPDVDD